MSTAIISGVVKRTADGVSAAEHMAEIVPHQRRSSHHRPLAVHPGYYDSVAPNLVVQRLECSFGTVVAGEKEFLSRSNDPMSICWPVVAADPRGEYDA